MRTFPYHELEKAMIKWFKNMREQKVTVSGPMDKEKPLNTRKGLHNFVAPDSWLDLFKTSDKENNIVTDE